MQYILNKTSSKKFLYELTHFDNLQDKPRLSFLQKCNEIDIVVHEDGSFSAMLNNNTVKINEIVNILKGDCSENI